MSNKKLPVFLVGLSGLILAGLVIVVGTPTFLSSILGGSDIPQVLQATTKNNKLAGDISFNLPSTFNEDVFIHSNASVSGTLTAPNILYGIIAGQNISISGGQTPTISASFSGVTSFQGESGELSLAAGEGIAIDGLTITNDDPGSAQTMFSNIKIGSTTLTAGSNKDTFELVPGSGIGLSTNSSGNQITITNTSAASNPFSGLTTNGVLYANSSSTATSLTPGTSGYILQSNGAGSAPSWIPNSAGGVVAVSESGSTVVATLDDLNFLGGDFDVSESPSGTANVQLASTLTSVTGVAAAFTTGTTLSVGTSLILGGDTIDDITGSGLAMTSNTLGINLTTSGSTGMTASNSGLEVAASGLTLLKGCGDTQILAWNDSSDLWECTNQSGGGGTNFWQRNNGAVAPAVLSNDLLLGDTATTSAKIGLINIGSGTPTATISAGAAGGIYLTATGNIATTNSQALTIGGASTGDIILSPNSGSKKVNSTGTLNIATGKTYQINNVDVLSATTLGSSVTTSSLTTVGALASGSITSGFGTILTGNTIQGSDITASGTTGFSASGNGAGMTFSGTGNHDITASSGTLRLGATTLLGTITGNGQNITGLGNLTATGTVNFSPSGTNGVTIATDADSLLTISGLQTGSGNALCIDGSNNLVTCTTGAGGISGSGTAGQIAFFNTSGSITSETAGFAWDATNNRLGIGNDTPGGKLDVTGANVGKALVILNETGDQNILAASASGTTVFTIDRSGNVALEGQLSDISGTTVNVNDNLFVNGQLVVSSTSESLFASSETYMYLQPVTSSDTAGYVRLGGYDSTGTTGARDLSLQPSGGNVGIGNTNPSSLFSVGSSSQFQVNATGAVTAATGITSSGTITFSGFTTNGGLLYTNGTGVVAQTAAGSAGQCLISNGGGAPSWGTCDGVGSSYWTLGNGALYASNLTTDLLVGGSASSSAKFAVLNVNSGTPTASISAGSAGGAYITATGNIATTNNQTLSLGGATTGNLNFSAGNGSGQILLSAGALSINGNTGATAASPTCVSVTNGIVTGTGSCGSGSGGSVWNLNASNGTLSPINNTVDVLLGGTASSSAKFGFLNVNSGTPTASVSAGAAGAAYLTATGNIQTTANQGLTIGGNTTGDITLSPLNGSGTVNSTGNLNLASGKTFNINGTSVLSNNTLGSGVVTSSLTTVGALNAGSITSGFGSIDVGADAISGGDITATGTTGFTGSGAGAGLTFNASGNHDITASSGTLRLGAATLLGAITGNNQSITGLNALSASGTITFGGFTTNGGLLYTNGTGVVAQTTAGGSGECLISNGGGAPSWSTCPGAGSGNYWNIASGTLYPINNTLDLLIGGTASSSAKFAVLGVNSGTPTASVSAGAAGGAYLTATGNIQTTANQGLTIGGNTTGDITLSPQNGSGTVNSTGSINLSSGKVIAINGTSVLSATTLGSGVIASSLTSVGALNNGSITSGFGSIDIGGDNLTVGGTITFSGFTTNGGLLYTNGSGVVAQTTNGTAGQCLISNGGGAPSWGTCDGVGAGYWTLANGALYASNLTTDLLIGSNASSSAKFAVLNVNSGTPTASVSAGSTGGAYLTADGNLQTTANQNLTLGGATTGNITLNPLNGSGTVNSAGNLNLASGKTFNINGTSVLSNNTLGSGVTTSSLTTVGALNSGSITSGFGAIDIGNDNLTTSGTVTFGSLSTGVVFSNGSGVLSSGALNLANGSSYVTGTLPVGNGGTGITSVGSAGSIAYSNGTAYAFTGVGSSGQCLQSNGSSTPAWATCGLGTNYWTLASGAIMPINSTTDLLVGGTASTSAKFAVLNVNSGTPTASVSAGSAGGAYLTAAGKLATTAKQSLTLGDSATGNIIFSGGNVGIGTTNPAFPLSVNGFVEATGFRATGGGLVNGTSFNNAQISVNTTGTVIDRNVADANPVLIAQNLHASSTGDILQLKNNSSTVFSVAQGGTVTIAGLTTNGGLLYTNGSGVVSQTTAGSAGQCLLSNGGGAPTFGTCGLGVNYWQQAAGALSPINSTLDFLVGGTASSSAEFAILNVNSGTPTASLSAGATGGSYFTAAGTMQTTANQTMTLGGNTTGNIALNPLNGAGTVTVDGGTVLSGTSGEGLSGAGLTDCDASGSKLLWDASTKLFSCGTDRASFYASQSATLTKSSNTSYQDTDLTFSVNAGEMWVVDYHLNYFTNTTADAKFKVTAPSNTVCYLDKVNLNGAIGGSGYTCGGGKDDIIMDGVDSYEANDEVNGVVRVGATAGSITMQWAQNSASGTSRFFNGSYVLAYKVTGADLAEIYYSKDTSVSPGDVVMVDSSLEAGVQKTQKKYDGRTLGIVSTNPGQVLGDDTHSGGKPILLALAGRVPVKVTTENGPIHAGDYLTTSSKPGIAMKATKPGQTIGKAMSDFDADSPENIGKIIVFTNLSWADPTVSFDEEGDLHAQTLEDQSASPDEINQLTAHMSAMKDKQDAHEEKLSSIDAKLASLSAKLDQFESFSTPFTASSPAELGLEDIDASKITISDTLDVIGRTTLTDLSVTGNLTNGVIKMDGLAGEINTLAGPLKLQANGLNDIDILDGKVTIAASGDITTKGELTAKKLNIDTADVLSASLGEAILPAGKTVLKIDTTAVASTSAIFITPKTKTSLPMSVTDQTPGKSFKVEVESALDKDITFNWWIIN